MSSDDRLLDYYERELEYLRSAGAAFARAHPKVAHRLELSADINPDPHVERLLEGFAFLAARLHRGIDDSASALANNLLEQLYPHAMRPVPSASIACFAPDLQNVSAEAGHRVPRDTELSIRSADGDMVYFKTVYDVALWPLKVAEVRLLSDDDMDFVGAAKEAAGVLKVGLECPATFAFRDAAPGSLGFYLPGGGAAAAALSDLLLRDVIEVRYRHGDGAPAPLGTLPRGKGLAPDEALLPESGEVHSAYRLLLEYFCFPLKFQFFDLDCAALGEGAPAPGKAGGQPRRCDLFFVLRRRPQRVPLLTPDDLRLGCTPVVNLFTRVSEPLRITGQQAEYRLVPDAHREHCTEIYRIDGVFDASGQPGGGAVPNYFGFNHAEAPTRFWHARRGASGKAGLDGTDMRLTFVDTDFQPQAPVQRTLAARLVCTNRHLASEVGANAALALELPGPVLGVRLLHKPTPQVTVDLDGAARWKLVSQLTLNQLSVVEHGALAALREVLALSNPARLPAAAAQIRGVSALTSRRITCYVDGDPWHSYRNGYCVSVRLDPALFRDSSRMLFCTVLQRFLALYAGINTVLELELLDDAGEPEHHWPALPAARLAL